MEMAGHFFLVSDAELRAAPSDPPRVHDLLDAAFGDRESDHLNAEQAWRCIHASHTDTAWEGTLPPNFIVSGGRAVGDEDVGFGRERALCFSST